VADLDVAAVLVAHGCRYVMVVPTRDPRRRAFLVAGDNRLIAQLLSSYRSGGLLVNAKAFVLVQRQLRRTLTRGAKVA
jgi:hypothetical protein